MKGLTKKQQQVLDFVQEFIGKHRYAPTYREISDHFSFRSVASVYKHIHALQKKGALSLDAKSARSMTLHEASKEGAADQVVPLMGQLAGGQPLEMFSHPQTLAVPSAFVQDPDKTYALRVVGEGLLEEQIADGDLLLVEARPHAQRGETVLAVINGENVLVKRYFHEEEYVRLEGTVESHQPIVLHQNDVTLQGIVVGLLRFYTVR